MTLERLPAWAGELIETARVARLAFADSDGRPRVLPITYAVDGATVWSAIDRKPKRAAEPARVRWLRERPAAALCIDRYADDWSQLAWVQLLGAVTVLQADAATEGLAALASRYSQYADEPPPGPVLRLDVERALSWRAADFD